jgi:hypothetical protein
LVRIRIKRTLPAFPPSCNSDPPAPRHRLGADVDDEDDRDHVEGQVGQERDVAEQESVGLSASGLRPVIQRKRMTPKATKGTVKRRPRVPKERKAWRETV